MRKHDVLRNGAPILCTESSFLDGEESNLFHGIGEMFLAKNNLATDILFPSGASSMIPLSANLSDYLKQQCLFMKPDLTEGDLSSLLFTSANECLPMRQCTSPSTVNEYARYPASLSTIRSNDSPAARKSNHILPLEYIVSGNEKYCNEMSIEYNRVSESKAQAPVVINKVSPLSPTRLSCSPQPPHMKRHCALQSSLMLNEKQIKTNANARTPETWSKNKYQTNTPAATNITEEPNDNDCRGDPKAQAKSKSIVSAVASTSNDKNISLVHQQYSHGKMKRSRSCKVHDCSRGSRGKEGLCQRHGGGRRCRHANCSKGAQGISQMCLMHGGGYRCTIPGCMTGSRGTSGLCARHGGNHLYHHHHRMTTRSHE
jgi:hypothetical protein